MIIAETDAIVTFLGTNSNVISLCDRGRNQTKRYNPRIEYGLLQNQAGRNIIQRSRRDMHVDQHGNTATDSKELFPPSILPFFLERAYKQSDRIYTCGVSRRRVKLLRPRKDSSGIYYLLQEMGPVVFGSVIDGIRRPRRRRSGSASTDHCRRLRRRLVCKTTK